MYKSSNEFSLHLEKIKQDNGFDSYIETLTFFYENETDHEFEEIVKMLNPKIKAEIEREATSLGLLKTNRALVTLL